MTSSKSSCWTPSANMKKMRNTAFIFSWQTRKGQSTCGRYSFWLIIGPYNEHHAQLRPLSTSSKCRIQVCTGQRTPSEVLGPGQARRSSAPDFRNGLACTSPDVDDYKGERRRTERPVAPCCGRYGKMNPEVCSEGLDVLQYVAKVSSPG